MYPNGHRGILMLLYAPLLAAFFWLDIAILGLVGLLIVFVTATWPDKDLNYWFLPHRGPTHSVWFAALIGVLFAPIVALIPTQMTAVSYPVQVSLGWFFGFYGIMGHIIGDIFTPTGVRPFYPYGERYTLNITSAKGVWWFETIKSGSQERMTFVEQTRHAILNSNRVFFVLGVISITLSFLVYSQ